ncbi:MAG: DUF3006 domain-containing protein [Oscillospiraceae bacterium]|nr:DUF3006 domain-containing protein [Oscillospiraceae bacterium]
MYYSVIQLKGPMVLTEDSFGDLQVFSREFFDYDVKENDMVYLKDGMFHYSEEETKKIQQENYDIMNRLFDK